jgi:hypothetical protein
MDNIYGNPNITDVVYHDTSQKYIFTSYDETSGQVFITDDIAHYYVSIPLTVSNTPLLTIFVVNGWPIVAGAGGYAAISKTQGNNFTVLPAGVTKDINDMLWTDTFIGAIACSDAVVGLNKFSGGASNVLTYKPVPLASTSSPGIVQPDNATLSVDTNGTLSAFPPPIPIATTTTLGGIKPDGTSITVNTSTGVASAVGGGGGGSDSWVPSSQYIDITYGVTGDTYVAPADGWIYVECTTFNTNASIIGNVIISEGTTLGVYMAGATTYSTGRGLYLLFPVGSGYFFRMFNSNLNIDIFRFVYAKGALVGV